MRPNSPVFADVPEHLRFHYRFLLWKRSPDDWSRGARISNKENREFIEFIQGMYDASNWRVQVPGTVVMHLWTRDDDWEMVAKLGDRFSDHLFHMTKDCRD